MKQPSNNSPRPPGLTAALVPLFFALLTTGSLEEAAADQIVLPRIGQQYFSTGLSLQPGFVHDPSAPADAKSATLAATGAGTARLGFHQIVSEQLVMAAEVDIGLQWLDEHTIETAGRADSETGVAWQIGLAGRWLPAGDRAGWSLGGGPHFYHVYLADRPVQSLGLDLRAGRFLWKKRERFVLLELGYAVPIVQGLSSSNSFRDDSGDRVPKNWTFHRFSISLQYGF